MCGGHRVHRGAAALVIAPILVCLAATAAWGAVATATVGEPIVVGQVAHHPDVTRALGRWGVSFAAFPDGPPWARLYDNAGLKLAEAHDAPLGDLREPALAAGSTNILMVYCRDEWPATGYQLIGLLYDAAGTLLHRLDLSASDDFPYYEPAVANQPGTDSYLVVYRRKPDATTGTHAFGLRVDTGTGQIVVSAGPHDYGGALGRPDVAFGRTEGGSGSYSNRYGVVFRPLGTGTVVHVQVAAATTGLGIGTGFDLTDYGTTVSDPAIASEHVGGNHDFIVAWSHGTYPADVSVVAQRLTGGGGLLGAGFTVATPDAHTPDVAASDTEYLIVWRDMPDPTTYTDRLRGRHCSFAGDLLATEFTIASDLGVWETEPAVASDGVSFAVAYMTDDATPLAETVLLQRVGAGAFTHVEGDVCAAAHLVRGVAWGDGYAPADRLPDVFAAVTGAAADLFFVNEGGALVARTTTALTAVLSAQGAAWADYDNSGGLDLYVTSDAGPNELYKNLNPAVPTFSAVGATFGVNDGGNGRSVAWGDFDGDGRLDLYVANKNAANRLYRNNVTSFYDVAAAVGVADAGNTEGVAFVDFDNDRDLDLCVGNAGGANRLFRYDGDEFTDVAAAWGLADAGSARSVSWADYDDDGDFDLFVSKYAEANALYRHDAATFVDVAPGLGLADVGRGESACWADIDLDGDLDLFLANYLGTSRLYRNEDHGAAFAEIGAFVGLDYDGPSVGAAWGDLDDDGDPDLCLGGYDGLTRIYRNDYAPPANHWVKLRLVGTTAPACAIGARVRVTAGPLVQTRDVGGGNGYLSQNDLTLIVGLGSRTVVDSLVVRWTGGGMDRFLGLGVDQTHVLVQGTGVTGVGGDPVPGAPRIVQNHPNPFNPGTRIVFELPASNEVRLALYDPRGRLVRELSRATWPAGRHAVDWDGRDAAGRDVPAGVYLVRMEAGGATTVMTVSLVR